MRRALFWLVGALFVMAMGLSLHRSVSAQANTAQGLQISPVIIPLNGDKGKTYTLKLSVLNVTTGDLVFNSAVNDFKSKDESGNPDILLDSNLPPTASIISWVRPIGSVPLNAKQSKDLNVTITIPSNAEAGGHYGVIRFTGTPPGAPDTGVSLAASAGVLLLVRVSGNITEELNIKDFFATQASKQSSWFENGPITIVQRINNTGNVHLNPQGEVVIKNMFGKNVATLKVNETGGNILPNSTRRFEETLNNKRLFGKYTASMSLAYGTKGQVLLGNFSFWIIPYKLIAALLLILILLILLLRWLLQRYNRWVINKAGSRSRY